jgi:hypothetical protein
MGRYLVEQISETGVAPDFGALRRTYLYTLKHDCQAAKGDSEKSLIQMNSLRTSLKTRHVVPGRRRAPG